MSYRHTQPAFLILTVLGAAAAAFAVGSAPGGYDAGEIALLGFLAVLAVFFASLTVEITGDRLRVWFGPGWIRRTIPLGEIESASAVRVPWYVGWGLRWWGYWLYNVSGRRAVVLRLRGGRRFGVGTDEPDALLAALSRAGVTVQAT